MKNITLKLVSVISITLLFACNDKKKHTTHDSDKESSENKGKTNKISDIFFGQNKKKDLQVTTSNAKQIFLLLVEFDDDFGAFPSEQSAEDNEDFTGLSTSTSNGLLGQFIAGGYIQSEEIFYAKGGASTNKKPDNDISPGKILEKGECGFAYVTGLSGSDKAHLPILCAPMTGEGYKFDPSPYGGKAIVLHLDGSVKFYPINENGEVVFRNGKMLFDDFLILQSKGVRLVFPK